MRASCALSLLLVLLLLLLLVLLLVGEGVGEEEEVARHRRHSEQHRSCLRTSPTRSLWPLLRGGAA